MNLDQGIATQQEMDFHLEKESEHGSGDESSLYSGLDYTYYSDELQYKNYYNCYYVPGLLDDFPPSMCKIENVISHFIDRLSDANDLVKKISIGPDYNRNYKAFAQSISCQSEQVKIPDILKRVKIQEIDDLVESLKKRIGHEDHNSILDVMGRAVVYIDVANAISHVNVKGKMIRNQTQENGELLNDDVIYGLIAGMNMFPEGGESIIEENILIAKNLAAHFSEEMKINPKRVVSDLMSVLDPIFQAVKEETIFEELCEKIKVKNDCSFAKTSAYRAMAKHYLWYPNRFLTCVGD